MKQITDILRTPEEKLIEDIENLRKNQFILMSPLRQEGKIIKVFEILPEGIEEIDKTETGGFKNINFDKFKSLLEYATELDSENPELQYNLGVIAAEANDVENAKKYYTRAIELNPKYVNAYINLAALILGQEESIIDEMNNLGTSAADDRRYDELRLERKELYFEAIPYLEQAIDIDSNNFQAARTLSNIYSATGDDAKAKEYRDLANSLEE